MSENSKPVSRLLAARNAQKPESIPNPMEISMRVENSGKLHLYDLETETTKEIEGQPRKDSLDKKNPLLDVPKENQLSFVVIDDETRFLSGLLVVNEQGDKEWFDSTMYRRRKDTISIYMRKKVDGGGFELTKIETDTVENLKPNGDDSEEIESSEKKQYKYDFGKMSSCQYIWAYCIQLDKLCRIQLSATGRNAYRLFIKKFKRNEIPAFTITGFIPSFGKDSKTKRQADAPVFEKYVPSNIDLEKAETYLDKTAAYTKMDLSALESTEKEPETIQTAAGDFEAYADMVGDVVNASEIPQDLPM